MPYAYYTLMHKNKTVVPVIVDEFGHITHMRNIEQIDVNHFPAGIAKAPGMTISNLAGWWSERAIQFDREDFIKAVRHFEIGTPEQFAVRSLGVSLTDCYWLKPDKSNLTWEQVNLYDNPMTPDVGRFLSGETKKINDYHSPDCTTNGYLNKHWETFMGDYYLLKAGSDEKGVMNDRYKQEPFSETVVSRLLAELKLPHARYDLVWKNGEPYSICQNFASEKSEFVPAYYIIESAKKPNDMGMYRHFQNCCEAVGAGDCTDMMNRIFAIDYIISNTDRHWGNFGFMRDPDTGRFTGPAPVFDNGNSLFYDTPTKAISPRADVPQKPFGSSRHDTLSLITDYSWLEFGKLSCLDQIIKFTGIEYVQNGLMTDERVNAIADATMAKAAHLERKALGLSHNFHMKKSIMNDSIKEHTNSQFITKEKGADLS